MEFYYSKSSWNIKFYLWESFWNMRFYCTATKESPPELWDFTNKNPPEICYFTKENPPEIWDFSFTNKDSNEIRNYTIENPSEICYVRIFFIFKIVKGGSLLPVNNQILEFPITAMHGIEPQKGLWYSWELSVMNDNPSNTCE